MTLRYVLLTLMIDYVYLRIIAEEMPQKISMYQQESSLRSVR